MPDALSRSSYPASSARDHFHGSAQAREEVKELERQERREEMAPSTPPANVPSQVAVVTRSGLRAEPSDEEDQNQSEQVLDHVVSRVPGDQGGEPSFVEVAPEDIFVDLGDVV